MPLDDESRARGRNRQKQLAAEMKTAIAGNVAAILSSLGRQHTPLEKLQAEAYCSLLYRAARLRDQGRSDLEVLRAAAEMTRDIAWLRGSVMPSVASPPTASAG
jgi:hypothetical protein